MPLAIFSWWISQFLFIFHVAVPVRSSVPYRQPAPWANEVGIPDGEWIKSESTRWLGASTSIHQLLSNFKDFKGTFQVGWLLTPRKFQVGWLLTPRQICIELAWMIWLFQCFSTSSMSQLGMHTQ